MNILYWVLGYVFTGVLLMWALDRAVKVMVPEQYTDPRQEDADGFFTFMLAFWPIMVPVVFFIALSESDVHVFANIFDFLDNIFRSIKNFMS